MTTAPTSPEPEETIQLSDGRTTAPVIFSCSKGLLAVVAHRLAEEDRLHLDGPVVDHWPEFARHAKDAITVRDVMSHRAGLPDLASDRWIQANDARPTVLQEVARRSGFEPILGHAVRGWTAKFGFVAAGLGVTVVPGLLTPLVPKTVAVFKVPDLGSRRVDLAATADSPTDVVSTLLRELRRVADDLGTHDRGG